MYTEWKREAHLDSAIYIPPQSLTNAGVHNAPVEIDIYLMTSRRGHPKSGLLSHCYKNPENIWVTYEDIHLFITMSPRLYKYPILKLPSCIQFDHSVRKAHAPITRPQVAPIYHLSACKDSNCRRSLIGSSYQPGLLPYGHMALPQRYILYFIFTCHLWI